MPNITRLTITIVQAPTAAAGRRTELTSDRQRVTDLPLVGSINAHVAPAAGGIAVATGDPGRRLREETRAGGWQAADQCINDKGSAACCFCCCWPSLGDVQRSLPSL